VLDSVIDTDAFNDNVTANYVSQSSIDVLDAGSTNRAYVIYKATLGVAYTTSHSHVVTYH